MVGKCGADMDDCLSDRLTQLLSHLKPGLLWVKL